MLDFQGLPIPHILSALILTAAFSVGDRRLGDDKSPNGEKAAVLLIAVALGFAVGGVAGAALGAVWFALARNIQWDVFGGSATPTTRKGYLLTFLRHALPVPLAMLIALWRDLDLTVTGLAFVGYAIAATALAAWYGQANAAAIRASEPIGKQNVIVEYARGAFYGLAMAAAMFVQF